MKSGGWGPPRRFPSPPPGGGKTNPRDRGGAPPGGGKPRRRGGGGGGGGEKAGGGPPPRLFIYGGVGLGKTHLMQAAGNLMLKHRPGANIAYVHSERFVTDMVKAFQHNAINE